MQAACPLVALAFALLVASCASSGGGGAAGSGGAPGTGGAAGGGTTIVHGAACDLEMALQPIEGHQHVAVCSPVTYGSNPPSSGNHYPIWAAYKTYGAPIPRGFAVHDLEHGAIVVTYNCADGCAADVAAIAAWADALPDDHACVATPIKRRLVIAPDPLLDVKFAAAAWGATLRAPCFDAAAFTDFYRSHIGQGPEIVCGDGVDLVAMPPAAGCP